MYIAASITNIAQLGSANKKMGVWYWVMMALGILMVIIAAVLITYYSRREFKKEMAKLREEKTVAQT